MESQSPEKTSVSLAEITSLQDQLLELDGMKDTLEDQLKKISEEMGAKKAKLIAYLNEVKMTSFRTPLGMAMVQKRFRVNLPTSPESWSMFWDYLKERGHYETLRTINHQKLNGWYSAELDAAVAKGEVGFSPPGLDPPKYDEYLVLRK
jgi:hypothetical protein